MDLNIDLIITIIGIVVIYKVQNSEKSTVFKTCLTLLICYFTLPHIGIIFTNIGYQLGNDDILSKSFVFLGDLFTYFK